MNLAVKVRLEGEYMFLFHPRKEVLFSLAGMCIYIHTYAKPLGVFTARLDVDLNNLVQ